ncbi:hypothetical protein ACVNS2_22560 [Paenibacillus caseinilyticus]|uniref:hypothetical protein n=1 Tax=Paenibacillus mucilaginosus TaxID=61624 RepID=UPI000FFEAE47|nr:hypothetical protein [Paenibacillus mucilaginosus]WFA19702.1 hypothetical protein ERY13_21880 [Paenibacillus mucilaginosus]
MIWQDPHLAAVHMGTAVRGVRLPDGWFQLQRQRVALIRYGPQVAVARDLQLEPEGLRYSSGGCDPRSAARAGRSALLLRRP